MTIKFTQIQNDKKVAHWLLMVAFAIFLMIVLGGATRLTHSGLSMVDWKPIMGIIPPITDNDWEETFSRYQEFPEYQKINKNMTMGAFKSIFYFEYFHRILGRLIGLLFVIPFVFFWLRGAIRKSMTPQMIILFVLGGFQGLLGWYMVKSGLVNNPQVSQYRLTAHLISAVMIYSYILWVAFGLLKNNSLNKLVSNSSKIYKFSIGMTALIIFMIITGGFVAGTKAGLSYNTFPLMAGKFIPDGMYSLQPFWLNWFENITTIQFNHRFVAYLLSLAIPIFVFFVARLAATTKSRNAAYLLLIMLIIQVSVGITTLLLHVPVSIAVIHQGSAIVLLSIAIFITRELKAEKIVSFNAN